MRCPEKARKAITLALLGAVALALVLSFTPEVLGRIIGLGAEAAFYVTFQRFQEREFADWQAANTTVQPSSGLRAVGWGFVGLILLLVIFITLFVVLSVLGLQPR